MSELGGNDDVKGRPGLGSLLQVRKSQGMPDLFAIWRMCAQGAAALSYKDVGAGRAPKVPLPSASGLANRMCVPVSVRV